MLRFAFRLLGFLLACAPAKGQEILGSDDPDFIAAKEAWLADDDEGVCQLIPLIDKGNPAAAWLYPGAAQFARECEERFEVYRSSYWIEDAVALDPLLERLVASGIAGVERLERLVEIGEPVRALRYLNQALMLARHNADSTNTASNAWTALAPQQVEWIDPELQLHFLMRAATEKSEGEFSNDTFVYWKDVACRNNDQAADPMEPLTIFCGVTQRNDFEVFIRTYLDSEFGRKSNRFSDALTNWLATDWRTEPYRKICGDTCAQTQRSCLWRLFLINASAYGLHEMSSPTELLIPQRAYRASERATGTLWRGIRKAAGLLPDWINSFTDDDPRALCLANALRRGETRWDRE